MLGRFFFAFLVSFANIVPSVSVAVAG